MQFEYDERKSESNLEKHGIDFSEAQELWADRSMVVAELECSDERRWAALARYAGSVWVAIYAIRGESIRIISVRRATMREVSEYDKANNDR